MSTVRHIFLLLSLFTATVRTVRAEEMPDKALITPGRLYWASPWLEGSNMAAHTLNTFFLTDTVSSLSHAALTADYSEGNLRNIYTPASEVRAGASVSSYMRIRRTFLYGRFGYTYDYGQNSRWRGFADPYRSPFMLADSIPGNISRETYSMAAGAALQAGKHTSLGLLLSYGSSLLSKHKDLRNKNTVMDFSITPSVVFHTRTFRAGLDLTYSRYTEETDYTQIDESTEKYLFEIYGLWLYTSSGYSGADHSRILISSAVSGNLTLELLLGETRIMNVLSLDYDYGSQTETGYNNLRYGDTRTLTWSDRLILTWGVSHRLEASAVSGQMLGYRFLQRQELDPDSGVRIWVTYGDPINSYSSLWRYADLHYTWRSARSMMQVRWEVTAGTSWSDMSRTAKEYPVYFSQSISSAEPYLKLAGHWYKGRSQWSISPSVRWKHVYSSTPDHVYNVSDMEITIGETPLQLEGPLMEEYSFLASSRIDTGLDLRYGWTVPQTRGSVLSVSAGWVMQTALGDLMPEGAARHCTRLSIGFTF